MFSYLFGGGKATSHTEVVNGVEVTTVNPAPRVHPGTKNAARKLFGSLFGEPKHTSHPKDSMPKVAKKLIDAGFTIEVMPDGKWNRREWFTSADAAARYTEKAKESATWSILSPKSAKNRKSGSPADTMMLWSSKADSDGKRYLWYNSNKSTSAVDSIIKKFLSL